MTRSILILGNSHLAAVRAAWPALEARHPDDRLTFFGAPGDKLGALTIRDGQAAAQDRELARELSRLGMPPRLDLMEFDAVAVIGGGIGVFAALGERVTLAEMPSHRRRRWWRPERRQLMSRALYVEMVADALRGTIGHRLVRDIGAEAGRPIYVCPQPRPGTGILARQGRRARLANAVRAGDAPIVAAVYEDALQRAFAGVACVRPQPEATVTEALCTADRYTTGSLRLAGRRVEHGAGDVLHANELYGMAVLTDLLDRIGQKIPPRLPAARSA